MASRDKIVNFLNDYLKISEIDDESFNGMQFIGKENVKKIVTGVSTSAELFEKAAKRKADMIVVHHGIFWKDVNPSIDKVTKKRLKPLFENNITLLAYHLPLDMHPKIGNNIQILEKLGLRMVKKFGKYRGKELGFLGKFKEKMKLNEFVRKVDKVLETKSVVYPYGSQEIKTVGIISGAGATAVPETVNENIDVLITGEPKEFAFHFAKDGKTNVIIAGHYKTERFGVQALGELLKKKL